MEAFLKSPEGKSITALFAHNDDMALGAIQAMEEAGVKPGKDIIIVSIDGVRGAFEAMVDGQVELHGRVQSALWAAAFRRGGSDQSRQEIAEAHRGGGRRLRAVSGRGGSKRKY